jgi:hypothetical protein
LARHYTAYVLRRWQQVDGREWVELQYIATGERRRFSSLADAYTWLQSQGQGVVSVTAPGEDTGPPHEESP